MSKRLTAALLIVSLTFNLAVLGVLLYRQFSEVDKPFRPNRPPFREMGISEGQRGQLMKIMRSFRRENRNLQGEIQRNEKALWETIRRQPADSATIDSLVGVIGRLKEEHSRRAMKKLSEAGKLLNEQQRGLLLDMLMRARPGRRPGGGPVPWQRPPGDRP